MFQILSSFKHTWLTSNVQEENSDYVGFILEQVNFTQTFTSIYICVIFVNFTFITPRVTDPVPLKKIAKKSSALGKIHQNFNPTGKLPCDFISIGN